MNLDAMCATWAPRVLSVLRIVTGLVFLQFGTAKNFGFPAVPTLANIQTMSMPGIGGLFELIGGTLLVLGLFTRPVAFLLSGEMAVVYFYAHLPRGFFPNLNGGSLPIMLCFVCLYIVCAGAGPWSLDAMMRKQD